MGKTGEDDDDGDGGTQKVAHSRIPNKHNRTVPVTPAIELDRGESRLSKFNSSIRKSPEILEEDDDERSEEPLSIPTKPLSAYMQKKIKLEQG